MAHDDARTARCGRNPRREEGTVPRTAEVVNSRDVDIASGAPSAPGRL